MALEDCVIFQPTAEQEAKHGKWVNKGGNYIWCSNCNTADENRKYTPFCPHCGAKMDLED